MSAGGALRVVVIAPLRLPIRRPHAGGLESAVWSEVHALRSLGHDVTLIALRGSDFVRPGSAFELPPFDWPPGSSPNDSLYPLDHEAITVPALGRALDVIGNQRSRFDVISNHCLHPLPLMRAPQLGVPMVTTLHTPVEESFVAAHAQAAGAGSRFLSVSAHTRREWARAGVVSGLLPNGVDPRSWPLGTGGDGLVWFGRIVPEKAPHLAVDVARQLGLPLTIAGRIGDRRYADEVFLPALGASAEYVGPLGPGELARLVGSSGAALATPVWEEPFGLVAPEALMCGTPVVSFAVGGVPEIRSRSLGMEVVAPADTVAMAAAVHGLIDRTHKSPGMRARIRESAVRNFSLDARMARLGSLFAQLSTISTIDLERSA